MDWSEWARSLPNIPYWNHLKRLAIMKKLCRNYRTFHNKSPYPSIGHAILYKDVQNGLISTISKCNKHQAYGARWLLLKLISLSFIEKRANTADIILVLRQSRSHLFLYSHVQYALTLFWFDFCDEYDTVLLRRGESFRIIISKNERNFRLFMQQLHKLSK